MNTLAYHGNLNISLICKHSFALENLVNIKA